MPNLNVPNLLRPAIQAIWDRATPEKRAQLVRQGKFTAEGQPIHQSALKDLGKTVGGALKVAAPIAALAIPGLGPVAAAAIAGGGEAAGGLLHGDKFNAAKTLEAGAAGYAGNKLLKGQGVKALIGNASGVAGTPATVAGGAAAPGTGIIDRAIGWAGKHPLDAAQIGLSALGTVQGAQRAGQADSLRQRALASVDPNAPFDAGLPPTDTFNPYGAQSPYPNRARKAALSSLGY